jgi:hypothetical protein
MPGLEEIIEAILRGQLSEDQYKNLTKPQVMMASETIIEILTPALPVLEEIKAAAWREGYGARDEYLLSTFVQTRTQDAPEEPKNPYGEA